MLFDSYLIILVLFEFKSDPFELGLYTSQASNNDSTVIGELLIGE